MDWKTINKADSVAYIALAVLGYAIPNIASVSYTHLTLPTKRIV